MGHSITIIKVTLSSDSGKETIIKYYHYDYKYNPEEV